MEQNFPVSVGVVADRTACWLVQDGFVTLYSPKRKTPIFTSERLEGDILLQVYTLCIFTQNRTCCTVVTMHMHV